MDFADDARIHPPYFSHSFCNDIHVLLGSTSKTFPSKGTPDGCGIGVVIVMSVAKSMRVVEISENEKMGFAETGKKG